MPMPMRRVRVERRSLRIVLIELAPCACHGACVDGCCWYFLSRTAVLCAAQPPSACTHRTALLCRPILPCMSEPRTFTVPHAMQAASGVRPSSMAALLRAAPQTVPFARRVDLLRAVLAYDKRAGRYDLPAYEGGVPPLKAGARCSA